jgi:hypothetical protein
MTADRVLPLDETGKRLPARTHADQVNTALVGFLGS